MPRFILHTLATALLLPTCLCLVAAPTTSRVFSPAPSPPPQYPTVAARHKPPSYTTHAPTLTNLSLKLDSSASLHLSGPSNRSWLCPVVSDIPDVSCTCDLPHTVRCRGDAADASTIPALTRRLAEAQVSLLDLAVHRVLHLPDGAFEELQLFGLIVSSAGLDSISKESFLGLEGSLAALGLPSNQLTSPPLEALQRLTRLQRLDLSDNELQELPSRAFPTLIQLHSLSLAGNKIRTIKAEAFVKLPQLRSLNLGRNQLDASQITERTLWGLHVLRELSLENNLLKGTLTPDYISGAPTLTSLDLSYNAITSIGMGALKNYPRLETLDLSHNTIDVIEDHALRHLTSLQELVLSHNRVVSVSGWSLAHVPKLTTLRLADNALLAVTADLVHQLTALITLDLAANDISLIQPQVFNSTPHLQHVNLADNPLHCDCALRWLREWLLSRPAMEAGERRTSTCATPLHLQNAPLVEVKSSELSCSDDPSYHDYHDIYSDYYHDAATPDLRLSKAEVSLQASRWTPAGLQLLWRVDETALPYACEAVFVYEVTTLRQGLHQLLTEKVDANCSSQYQRDPERVEVTIPGSVLTVGSTYRYCLVLLEYGTGDQEGFLPGCSEPLLLTSPPPNLPPLPVPPPTVNSLTAGGQGGLLVVHTRIQTDGGGGGGGAAGLPCTYTLVIVSGRGVAASRQLNCSEARHTFPSLLPGQYTACVAPDGATVPRQLQRLERSLKEAGNVTQLLQATFPACTPETELKAGGSGTGGTTEPLFVLLFTLPGLALIVTLYVIGRRVWRGGGVPWRWDPRANKSAKYFLYTGDTSTPSVSMDPLPVPVPETTTRV